LSETIQWTPSRANVDERMPRRAVFLDRDGTICDEVSYLNHVSRLRIFPFAAAAIRKLNEAGPAVIVVIDQAGIAWDYFPESLVHEIHEALQAELRQEGAHIDYCPHSGADACACRKPNSGMLERAAREHMLDLPRSFVVGDRHGGVEFAHNARARSIFVRTGYGEGDLARHSAEWPIQPNFVALTLTEAVDWILEQSR
jgi:D-glycero-D-manno-heptose 1,7-bisphosphate phosphatase